MEILKVENINKTFDDLHVLKGVSFGMNKGEVVAIAVNALDGVDQVIVEVVEDVLDDGRHFAALIEVIDIDTADRERIEFIRMPYYFLFH